MTKYKDDKKLEIKTKQKKKFWKQPNNKNWPFAEFDQTAQKSHRKQNKGFMPHTEMESFH